MNRYWLALYRPVGYDPSIELDATDRRRMEVFNREMRDAGVTIFVGGLRPGYTVTSFTPQPDGKVVGKAGPQFQGTHYVDGFWVLTCRDIQEAEEWAIKAAQACRGSVEARPFY
jgi:hypothetical protein